VSLWTPDGERPIQKEAPPQPAQQPPPGPGGEPSLEDLSPEERVQAEAMMAEMADAQKRIAETPAAEVVANHLMGFYELGAIHLSQQPPNFSDASLAIDALGAALDKVGDQLGDNGKVLSEALGQIRMAFVQLQDQGEGGTPAETS
jgi:hypothetical protein